MDTETFREALAVAVGQTRAFAALREEIQLVRDRQTTLASALRDPLRHTASLSTPSTSPPPPKHPPPPPTVVEAFEILAHLARPPSITSTPIATPHTLAWCTDQLLPLSPYATEALTRAIARLAPIWTPTEAEHFSTATLVPLHLVSFAALHPSLWSAYLSSSIDLALDALDALSDLDLPTPRDDTEGIEEIFRAHVACGTAFSHLLEILVPRGRSTRDGPMSMGRSTVEVLLPKAQTLLARAHGTGHLIVTRTAEHVLARIVSLMHHHHQHPSPEGSEDHDT